MASAWVYVLRSTRNGRYYIGHTVDLERRLATHNAGRVKATKYLRPWSLVYSEEHANATAARKREWQLKQMKSRLALEALINSAG